MSKYVTACPTQASGQNHAAEYCLNWSGKNPGMPYGGATGSTPIGLWTAIVTLLQKDLMQLPRIADRHVVFLDEYFGPFPSYHHWGYRNLLLRKKDDAEINFFSARNVYYPRGCFYETDENAGERVVTSDRLHQILCEAEGDWERKSEPGENGIAPEIRIRAKASHSVLREIRESMAVYDRFIRSRAGRLQILGIGVTGHIGFVECGAAERDTNVMLVELSESTLTANQDDFRFYENGMQDEVRFEPARYAITQGIGTILSAGTLLMMAWGKKKRVAVERMLMTDPGPQNPAGWVQEHDNVHIFLDQEAFGDLDPDALRERGFEFEQILS